jgi:hypothetical protein
LHQHPGKSEIDMTDITPVAKVKEEEVDGEAVDDGESQFEKGKAKDH